MCASFATPPSATLGTTECSLVGLTACWLLMLFDWLKNAILTTYFLPIMQYGDSYPISVLQRTFNFKSVA